MSRDAFEFSLLGKKSNLNMVITLISFYFSGVTVFVWKTSVSCLVNCVNVIGESFPCLGHLKLSEAEESLAKNQY